MKRQHAYGWVPDIPDQRDFVYTAIRPKLKLPAIVDLRKNCSPVEDQGQLGSCTANALAGNIEFIDKSNDGKFMQASRLFIYYNERFLTHSVKVDSGATLRDGIKTLSQKGVCDENLWPYVIDKFTTKPTVACYTQALVHRIVSYHRLQTLDEMLTCLADGYPFVFGFTVYESFESPSVAKTGVMPMPAPSERALGGHAVMAVGYDQKNERLLIRNSWGDTWGQKGYFTMPFAFVKSSARDFWTIRK